MTGLNPWQSKVEAIVHEIDPHGIYIKVRPKEGRFKNVSFFLFWREGVLVAGDVEIVIILAKRDDKWMPEAFWPGDVAPLEEL